MKRLIYLFLLSNTVLMVTGCGNSNFFSFPGVYKMDVQQGNIFTEKEVGQLKPGMTKSQVAFIMGNPVLSNLFNKDRWDYIYSFQPGGKEREQKRVTLFFKNDKLSRITGDLLSHQGKPHTVHLATKKKKMQENKK